MKRNFICFLMVAALSLFAACTPSGGEENNGGNTGGGNNDAPLTPPTTELEANTYSIDGVVGELNSVAVEQYGENIYIIATPTSDVASAAEIFECNEYIYAAVSPTLIGKEINLTTESEVYTVMSTLRGAMLDSVSPEFKSEITGGSMTFAYSNDVVDVKAELRLVGGVVLKFHLTVQKQVEVNKNIIKRGNEEKPLRATFYMEDGDQTYFYFTPSELYYFEELDEMATWYVYIGVDNSCIDGTEKMFGAETLITFGAVDNVNYSKSMEIYGDDLQGATGRYTITKNGEGNYSADILVSVNGSGYKVEFDGECISHLLAPEKKINYVAYGGAEHAIVSATVATIGNSCIFTLTTSNDENIVITAPENLLDGEPHGFSQFPELQVTYNGRTYCKTNGDSGTLTIHYKSISRSVEIDFTDYSDITLNYVGNVTKL